MIVRELIEILNDLDPELRVIKQKDDEGNGYQQVNGADITLVEESEAGDWMIEFTYADDEEEDMDSPVRVAVIY